MGTDVLREMGMGMAHAIDGDKVVAFCDERITRMKNPLTAAIYAGMKDRVKRGFFDMEEEER